MLLLFGLGAISLYANQDDWDKMISEHPGSVGYARDRELGTLVDRNRRDPFWASAIDVCDSVFSAVKEGRVPSDAFYEPTRGILETSFKLLLNSPPPEFSWRYGLPERNKVRLTIPVRVNQEGEEDTVVYGYIYMIQADNQWFIEQWAVDLSF